MPSSHHREESLSHRMKSPKCHRTKLKIITDSFVHSCFSPLLTAESPSMHRVKVANRSPTNPVMQRLQSPSPTEHVAPADPDVWTGLFMVCHVRDPCSERRQVKWDWKGTVETQHDVKLGTFPHPLQTLHGLVKVKQCEGPRSTSHSTEPPAGPDSGCVWPMRAKSNRRPTKPGQKVETVTQLPAQV